MSSYSFQPTTAPGRETSPAAPAQPSQGPPPTQGTDGGQSNPLSGGMMLLFILLPFLLLMLMNRSQTKKQKQIEASLKVGDRVITQSGLVGKLVDVGERQVKLEIAPGVNVQMLKGAITGPEGGDQKAAEAKAKEPSKEPSKDKPQEKKA